MGKYGRVDMSVRVPLGECVVWVCTYVKLCERAYSCETASVSVCVCVHECPIPEVFAVTLLHSEDRHMTP